MPITINYADDLDDDLAHEPDVAERLLAWLIDAHLIEAPAGECLSGNRVYLAYAYLCESHHAVALPAGTFGAAVRRAFPNSNQAAWPREDGSWEWAIDGVQLRHAATTRELLMVLTPLTAGLRAH